MRSGAYVMDYGTTIRPPTTTALSRPGLRGAFSPRHVYVDVTPEVLNDAETQEVVHSPNRHTSSPMLRRLLSRRHTTIAVDGGEPQERYNSFPTHPNSQRRPLQSSSYSSQAMLLSAVASYSDGTLINPMTLLSGESTMGPRQV
jgi:hypothetical protein